MDDDMGFWVLCGHGHGFPAEDRNARDVGRVEHVVEAGRADEARGSCQDEMHVGREQRLCWR